MLIYEPTDTFSPEDVDSYFDLRSFLGSYNIERLNDRPTHSNEKDIVFPMSFDVNVYTLEVERLNDRPTHSNEKDIVFPIQTNINNTFNEADVQTKINYYKPTFYIYTLKDIEFPINAPIRPKLTELKTKTLNVAFKNKSLLSEKLSFYIKIEYITNEIVDNFKSYLDKKRKTFDPSKLKHVKPFKRAFKRINRVFYPRTSIKKQGRPTKNY